LLLPALKKVFAFADGACSGNPGCGGWACVLRYGSATRELSGSESDTTNNRMELTAAIKALEALKFPCEVVLTSDSRYLVDAVNKRWVYDWKSRGWKRKGGKPALNPDLWERLLALLDIHRVSFVWVEGHSGHPENERCDMLAVEQSKNCPD
jgi:ribonuclease HI